MNNSTQLVGYELEARELLNKLDINDNNIFINQVFLAKWSCALDFPHIIKIAEALTDVHPDIDDLYDALRAAVKLGVLRTRRIKGDVFYELKLS